jgi:methionine-rich copper-binding protein CopC
MVLVHVRRLFPLVLAVVAAGAAAVGAVDAHSGVESSIPESGSTVDEAIDEVFIEFGVPISDDVEIALLDPDEEPLPTETERLSDTSAVARFDPIEEQGTYIARYLTTEPEAGHLLVGAISFDYGHGSSDGGISARTWLGVGALCLAILLIGALFSLMRHRAAQHGIVDDEETPLTSHTQL